MIGITAYALIFLTASPSSCPPDSLPFPYLTPAPSPFHSQTGVYMSPEVIDARGHGKPVDLFATGVVLFRVLAGKFPFRGITLQECYEQAISGKADFHGREFRDISKYGKQFCSSLLDPDPSARPTANQALSHPWFTEDREFLAEQMRYLPPQPKGSRMQSVRHLARALTGMPGSSATGPGSSIPIGIPHEPRSLPFNNSKV
jgi:serine/threonine protein kinase